MSLLSDLLHQEVGYTTPAATYSHTSSNEYFVRRMQRRSVLESHSGCVNAITFTSDGTRLLSSGDDRDLKIWDWEKGILLENWESTHLGNVFQVKPLCDDRYVTSGADGQVLSHTLLGSGFYTTERLAFHNGRVHKVALSPENGCGVSFLSCSEDGNVFAFDLRSPVAVSSKILIATDSFGEPLELYSVHFNPLDATKFCVGGADPFVRVFDLRMVTDTARATATPVRRFAPRNLCLVRTNSGPYRKPAFHITCAVYSRYGEILATYNDDNIYLFSSLVASGSNLLEESSYASKSTSCSDEEERLLPRVLRHSRRDGRNSRRDAPCPRVVYTRNMSDCMYGEILEGSQVPTQPPGIGSGASSSLSEDNEDEDEDEDYEREDVITSFVWSAILENRSLDVNEEEREREEEAAADFATSRDGIMGVYQGHRNEMTVKGVSFFGSHDEWIVSGSDCGYLYCWNRKGKVVWTSKGDDSVVNCIEPHPFYLLTMATSGIDNDIKIWGPTATDPYYLVPEDWDRMRENDYQKKVQFYDPRDYQDYLNRFAMMHASEESDDEYDDEDIEMEEDDEEEYE